MDRKLSGSFVIFYRNMELFYIAEASLFPQVNSMEKLFRFRATLR